MNIFLYKHNTNNKDYLIIGSVTDKSHFSLVLFFEEVKEKGDPRTKFDYIGEISATVLQTPNFFLDALMLFENYLAFTNHKTLYILDVNNFIAAPVWFNPIQIRSVDLAEMLAEFSQNLYTEITNITEILMVDRCLGHITVYIHTQYSGTLMLEVNKDPFINNVWLNTPMRLNTTSLTGLHYIRKTF